MRKIYLTEEQFRTYIERQITESIFMEKDAGKFAAGKMKNVTDYLANKAKSATDDYESSEYNDKENPDIIRQARELGINIDSLKGEKPQIDRERRVKELLKTKNEEINDWVKSALPTLRMLYTADGGSPVQTFSQGKEYATIRRGANGELINVHPDMTFEKLNGADREKALMVRDFLDKEGLTFLYRPAEIPKSFSSRFGVDLTKHEEPWKTPVEELNIDFSNITDSDIKQYYEGTRIAWINKELEKLGYPVERYDGDGKAIKIKDTDVAWKGEDGKKGLEDVAREGKLKMTAERYVKRRYGMDFVFGDGKSVFSFGNQKIDDRTLIVNFSAALRCPAWNECLLKDACYARTTEKNYDNAFDRNLRMSLVWSQTKNDEYLTNLMLELIRSYIFNYWAAMRELNKSGFKGKFTQDSLSKLSMHEIKERFGDDVIDILSRTKRADIVRLNEDGDFIGQWLVDVWDKWAEDFKLAGVTVAAYTCRALNYEKVKNIILNLSQEGLVHGQNAPAVARYFYAVEPKEYDALAETYGGPLTGDTIIPAYMPLSDGEGLKAYYYKCPCGRGRMKYQEINKSELTSNDKVEPCTDGEFRGARPGSKKLIEFNGKLYRLVKNEDASTKVDCYKCRICYGRDNNEIQVLGGGALQQDIPIYVLVSAHGAARDNFSKERKLAGRDANEWIAIQNGEKMNAQAINESTNAEENGSSPLAIKKITRYAIESVAEHMRSKNGTIMEINSKFNDMLEKLK